MPVSSARRLTAHKAIGRLCASGLPGLELLRQVAAHVRAVVPYAAGGWLCTDPATLLFTAAFVENVEREDCLRIKANELAVEDFAKFDRIARRGRRAASLLAETGGQLDRSPRYREIYRRIGVQDELRAVFRAGGSVLGVGCWVRVGADPRFSQEDLAFVASVADLVGEGLRRALRLEQVEAGGGDVPGIVVLGPDDSVHSITPEARCLLEEMAVDVGMASGLPTVVHHVAQVARRGGWDGAAVHPPARIRLPSGRWLLVHASRLTGSEDGADRVAVVLQPARRAQLARLIVDLYGLTEREREVTELLVRGLAVKEIAGALAISLHTTRDHVKAIFEKFRVTSRPELTAKLVHGPTVRR
jgi:DNA-binding CsgD family transcriptional regulator